MRYNFDRFKTLFERACPYLSLRRYKVRNDGANAPRRFYQVTIRPGYSRRPLPRLFNSLREVSDFYNVPMLVTITEALDPASKVLLTVDDVFKL